MPYPVVEGSIVLFPFIISVIVLCGLVCLAAFITRKQ